MSRSEPDPEGGPLQRQARELQRDLASRLPPEVRVAVDARFPRHAEHPEERALVEHTAVRRKVEFGLGRRAAHAALAELGRDEGPLLVRDDRSPAWPEGVVGSISHAKRLAVALVAERESCRAVGVDLEDAGREPSTGVWKSVFRTDEPWSPTHDDAFRDSNPDPTATVRRRLDSLRAFCAKEASYKALSAWTGRIFDFQDVRLAADGDGFVAEAVDARLRADLAPHLGESPRWTVGTTLAGLHVTAWVVLLEA